MLLECAILGLRNGNLVPNCRFPQNVALMLDSAKIGSGIGALMLESAKKGWRKVNLLLECAKIGSQIVALMLERAKIE